MNDIRRKFTNILLVLLIIVFTSILTGCSPDEGLIAGKTYTKGELYAMAGAISYVPRIEGIQIDGNLVITDSEYDFMGNQLETFTLTERNFDDKVNEFMIYPGDNGDSMAKIRTSNKIAYYVISTEENLIWYFLIQNDGSTYLAWLWSEGTINYIFKLEESN